MESFIWLTPLTVSLAFLFVGYLIYRILRYDEGDFEMKKIAQAVREGAVAYLKRQYKGVSIVFIFIFFLLLFLAFKKYLVIFVPFAFLSGGFFSALAGYIGMTIATLSSSRTTQAAKKNLNESLKVAFSSGAVMGLTVVGLGLLHLSIWYYFLNWYYQYLDTATRLPLITTIILCSTLGASFQALFARVGGGIFTKAADVGADLVGKIEIGIPEDDPRNPAVIADNVGDNVGDVCGMGADLYESYIGSIVATMSLAIASGLGIKGIALPLIIASFGILSSIIGTFFIRINKETNEPGILLTALRKGIFTSAILLSLFSIIVILKLLGTTYLGLYGAVISGNIAGIIIGLSTEYYTSSKYTPTKYVSEASKGGPATVIMSGLSIGMLSTAIPVITISMVIIISYYLAGGKEAVNLGLYGVGLAAVGMLSTLGITLASDAYGPVADNAGGNAEMSHQPQEVRKRTDSLDALGNTTAATGKGFAIGAAALTTLALIVSYKDQAGLFGKTIDLEILNPKLIAGLFIGGMLPFIFCSILMKAVGKTAQKIVVEVRRQFKEISGLIEGKTKPDYAHCVDICANAAQKEIILPSFLAIIAPLITGILIGVEGTIGFLSGTLITGFILAIMMANAGGSWDNAKKNIEAGEYGGKGSLNHKASIVGDTIGDPFKDTAGPSLNILIKLMSLVAIVCVKFIIKITVFK